MLGSHPVAGMFPESLDHYLSHSDSTGRLMAHAGLLLRLSRIYREVAPTHLAAASRVANFKSGTVLIHADNGAVAVKLRQMAPSLSREFSIRGIECTGLTVKVQALDISRQSDQPVVRPLSPGAGRELKELADSLPDSPLRDAVETLLERSLRVE